jgi:UDP-N-acetylmuramate dehydrogenase
MEILKNEPLSKHTFYGVGGIADEFWKITTSEKFDDIWAETNAMKIPYLLIGKGSNLLLSDRGFRGRVFVLEFEKVRWKNNFVKVESGKNFQQFIEETNKKGFEDLCNLSGIPGNVGAFIRGNAGAFGLETKDFLKSVDFLDENGRIKTFHREQCAFDYRDSLFKKHPKYCILSAIFELTQKSDPEISISQTRNLQKERWKKYPPGRSGGSFFKNPPGNYAGKLLEMVGAKGDQIGNAQISDRHANFILNRQGKATQKDILTLARKWKTRVHETFGINLEPEVFICDEYGKKIEL